MRSAFGRARTWAKVQLDAAIGAAECPARSALRGNGQTCRLIPLKNSRGGETVRSRSSLRASSSRSLLSQQPDIRISANKPVNRSVPAAVDTSISRYRAGRNDSGPGYGGGGIDFNDGCMARTTIRTHSGQRLPHPASCGAQEALALPCTVACVLLAGILIQQRSVPQQAVATSTQ